MVTAQPGTVGFLGMGERGIDRVQVALSRQTITIPWESRQALLERLRRLDSMRDIVGTF